MNREHEDQRTAVFDELLERALRAPEVVLGTGGADAISRDELRSIARDHRQVMLDQAAGAEEDYRRAVRQSGQEWRGTGWAWTLAVSSAVTVALLTLVAAGATGWATELKNALTEGRAVDLGTVVVEGVATLLGIAVLAAGAGAAGWWGHTLLSRAVGSGEQSAESRRLALAAGAAAVVLALVTASGVGVSAQEIAWMFQHGRPPGPDDGYGWMWGVVIGVLLLFAATYWLWWQPLLEIADDGYEGGPWRRLEGVWRETLYESVLGFLRSHIGARRERGHATTLGVMSAPGLRRVRALDHHVVTPAEETLIKICDGMDGGSIALAGPRGAGKSELLHAYCKGLAADRAAKFGVQVTVPVAYDRREFMLHLFARLCRRVMAEKLAAAPSAAKLLRRIQYQSTRSGELGANAGWGSWGLSARRGTSHTRHPLAYPEIVQMLVHFLGVVARELHDAEPRRRLVIAIDELDRLVPATAARDFLNELKAIFDVPHCLFLLSVSDEALREADLARAGRRDAFDSAIDEVVRVEPLDFPTTLKLLDSRVIGLPTPFAALFHCLSGGMPRDLLRTARAAVALLGPDQPRTLAEVTAVLIERELGRIANGAGDGGAAPVELVQFFRVDMVAEREGTGRLRELGDRVSGHAAMLPGAAGLGAALANRAYFLDTVSEIFSANLTRERVTEAAQPGFPGSFSMLARVQREIGTADVLARSTLDDIRKAWALPPL